MPHAEGDAGTVFLSTPQAMYFAAPSPTPISITDTRGASWAVVQGLSDFEQRHFGIFDGVELVARITLTSPALQDVPATPYWCSGNLEVVDRLQGRGIAHQLIDQLVVYFWEALASDVTQTVSGGRVWKKLIALNPGKVDLYDVNGNIGTVMATQTGYAPEPWQHDDRRLVLRP